MKRPKLLDAFCRAGGAGMGYSRAGFDVTGIDIHPQPDYPFSFIQGDAISYIEKHGHKYDIIHASPPCQKYSVSTAPHRAKNTYPDLVGPTREALKQTGKPYIIENVPQAPIRPDIVLMGHIFGLKVLRRRHFELSFFMLQPGIPHKIGSVREGDYCSVFGKAAYRNNKNDKVPKFRKKTVVETWKYAMGIDWMKKDTDLSEAIPPAYTEYIGKEAMRLLFTNHKNQKQ